MEKVFSLEDVVKFANDIVIVTDAYPLGVFMSIRRLPI
jgi:hypothetical protein